MKLKVKVCIFTVLLATLGFASFAGDDPSPEILINDKEVLISILENQNIDKEYKNYLQKYGENDSGTNLVLLQPIIEGLSKYYKTDLDLYFKCIDILSRVKNLRYKTQNFHNPISDMIDNNDIESFNRTNIVLPALKKEPDNYWSGNYLAPIGYAVSKNKIDWVKLLINSGVNVNDEAYVYGKGYESYYRMNLLSIASDDKMTNLLKKSGINTIASIAWDSYCKDDNVRLRASYSINSEVIGKINKGDKFKVVGHTYEYYKLPNGEKNRWVNIEVNGVKAWIWGAYVWEYQR